MRISIQNLGVVKNADIDMRPLTIFVGPNNAGKTWTAYSLAAILGLRGVRAYANDYAEGRLDVEYPLIDNAVKQILERGDARVDLVRFVEDYGNIYFNDFARHCVLKMEQLVGVGQEMFDKLNVRVELTEVYTSLIEKIVEFYAKGKGGQLNALKEKGETFLYYYVESGDEPFDGMPLSVIRSFVAEGIFRVLHRSVYSYVYTLPTERTAVMTMTIERLLVEDAQAESLFEKVRHNEPTEPIGHLIALMVNSFRGNHTQKLEQRLNNAKYRKFAILANILEQDILDGDVMLEPQMELEGIIRCQFSPGPNVYLPMFSSSSMVKELTPLVLYLRYLARPNELIVIDEPEMNLHPEAQASLIEFLAMLVNSGLHVLITTHSPYMIDHLVNLMRASEHSDKEEIKDKFFLKDVRAFIPKNAVGVYLFEQGEARSILDEDGLIDWGTFANVSDRISEIFYQL